MNSSHTQLRQTLRAAGQSLTTPRLVVFDYLSGRGPVRPAALIAACLPRADRASIYRTLDLFRRLGIIEDLVSGGHKAIELSEDFSPHHHHLTCTSCGRSLDITDKPIERRLENIAEAHGFLATSHQVEVSGLCASCRG